MQQYAASLTLYNRLPTKEVNVGGLLIGNFNPIRLQTMTTTDTMDTEATVAETIRCIEAGSELVRITAPSKKEAENLLNIKNELNRRGYHVPLVADIHFTPNAAEVAARIVEKVRINPGNYVDKKKFEQIDFTDADYVEEIERIRKRFVPLIKICKEYGTAMRIGTNHGSLSDRIMSRYGDTPMGMVESAMEFLRIARDESYHNIVLSMKASNPHVMVQAYRLLTQTMFNEFGECYPLHLGVTEAGDGEDGRIKSAVGIGTLLEDGLGDTVRVSLTEASELEIPVCRNIVKRYTKAQEKIDLTEFQSTSINTDIPPTTTNKRITFSVNNIGGRHVPVVISDYSHHQVITYNDLKNIGYTYEPDTDKWNIGDIAADYIFTSDKVLPFSLPGTLNVIVQADVWEKVKNKEKYFPLFSLDEFANATSKSDKVNFVTLNCFQTDDEKHPYALIEQIAKDNTVVFCISSSETNAMQCIRSMFHFFKRSRINNPVILKSVSNWQINDEHLIHFATETGALLVEGFGNGIWLTIPVSNQTSEKEHQVTGRTYLQNNTLEEFVNNTSFGILQATRTRISKTEYISCPSCGRTLFDLQETTAKIRARTNHLKGVKIAIMGCIVNGPGEMADADFGYVGSGEGKITLYKGKEVVKRNIDSKVAVDELIELLKENGAWVEPPVIANN